MPIKSGYEIYLGEFSKGKKEGYGMQKDQDGTFYISNWNNNVKNGSGKVKFENSENWLPQTWYNGAI